MCSKTSDEYISNTSDDGTRRPTTKHNMRPTRENVMQRRGKGGHAPSHNRRHRDCTPPKKGKNSSMSQSVLNKTIMYMPPYVKQSQLRAVGLCTRAPDRYELCPPGFSVLEDVPSVVHTRGRPRGRGKRGRPRISRQPVTQRDTEEYVSRADTSHRHKTTKRKPLSEDIARRIETMENRHSPTGHNRSHRRTKHEPARVPDVAVAAGVHIYQKPIYEHKKRQRNPLTSDEDQLPTPSTSDTPMDEDYVEEGVSLTEEYPHTRSRRSSNKRKKYVENDGLPNDEESYYSTVSQRSEDGANSS